MACRRKRGDRRGQCIVCFYCVRTFSSPCKFEIRVQSLHESAPGSRLHAVAGSMPGRAQSPPGDLMKRCEQCVKEKPREAYSKTQWRQVEGIARCTACLQNRRTPSPVLEEMPMLEQLRIHTQVTLRPTRPIADDWKRVAGKLVCEEFSATQDLSRALFILLDSLIPESEEYAYWCMQLTLPFALQLLEAGAPHILSTGEPGNWAATMAIFGQMKAGDVLEETRSRAAAGDPDAQSMLAAGDSAATINRKMLYYILRAEQCGGERAVQPHLLGRETRTVEARRGTLPPSVLAAAENAELRPILEWLLDGGDVNATSERDQSMFACAAMGGNVRLMQVLVARGADVDQCWSTHWQQTPLMMAAMMGKADAVEYLIAVGARTDPHSVDDSPMGGANMSGMTALDLCEGTEREGCDEAARLLRDAGAPHGPINQRLRRRTPEPIAASRADEQTGHPPPTEESNEEVAPTSASATATDALAERLAHILV